MAEALLVRKGGSSGNATASDLLSGKTATVSTGDITGTMSNNGTVSITPSTTNQTIAQGYHSGSGVVYGDSDLIASNIKNGVNIFGVTGTFNPQYTAKYNFSQPGTTATYNYDFGTSVIASIARFVGSNGSDSNFNCVVSGSNDNSTFTSLYNADLRGWGTQAGTYANLGSTPYRYYRVAVTALATSTYCSHGFVLVPNGTMGV